MAQVFVFRQLINGEWRDAENGTEFELINPATGKRIATVPFGDGRDATAAIEAAAGAFPDWSQRTPYERAALLLRLANLIRERLDDLYPVNIAESGKTIADAKGDLLAAAALFEWYAEEGKRAYGRTIPSRRADRRHIVLRQPIGVVGTITAWNFPAYNPCRAWSAALAAGCTVVGRPSEYTPMTAMAIANLAVEAGFPPGVLNVINGMPESMGEAMLSHPAVRKIAFTGSTRVGRLLLDGASRTMTRLTLECGGNAPVLILPDADLDEVLAGLALAKCRNVGQVCVAPQRYLVHESMREDLARRAAEAMAQLRVGDGADPGTEVGPLVNAAQRDRVADLVARAAEAGGKVLTGGRKPERTGCFFEPTVVDNVTPDSPLFTEEIFGPVIPVTGFRDVDEAVDLANRTEYGLAAFVFTRDLKMAVRVAERLEFGMVAINDWAPHAIEGPFPGWKQSGQGVECGQEGLEDYLETKLVSLGGISP